MDADMDMDGLPNILRLAHAIIGARSLQECEYHFAALCKEDLEAADHFAVVLVDALPHTAPLWQSILEHMRGRRSTVIDWQAAAAPILACDAVDTAHNISENMGWRDMEPDR